MTTDWQSPKVEKPPQGTKILWFTNGDVFVAQRFGDKYLCLQPGEAKILEEPNLWALCPVPEPYGGKMYIKVHPSNDKMTIDEMEERYPELHKEYVQHMQSIRFEE